LPHLDGHRAAASPVLLEPAGKFGHHSADVWADRDFYLVTAAATDGHDKLTAAEHQAAGQQHDQQRRAPAFASGGRGSDGWRGESR
jgi:hypothetical protein